VAPADHGLSALLALLVILIFVVQPLGEIGVAGRVVTTLFFALVLISGVWAVAGTRRSALVVAAVVTAALLVRGLRLWLGSGSLVFSNALVSLVFCVVVVLVVLAQVFREGAITMHRIQGAVAAYLLLGMAWAFAYELVVFEWPAAFTMPAVAAPASRELISHFVYFSFVTLTTVGYGDVTAVHPVARSLVTTEALVGQLFPAILLARLVSMELLHRDDGAANKEIRA
jgi:hypothetical protein